MQELLGDSGPTNPWGAAGLSLETPVRSYSPRQQFWEMCWPSAAREVTGGGGENSVKDLEQGVSLENTLL